MSLFGYSLQWAGDYGPFRLGFGFRRYPWVPFALDVGHWCIWIEKDGWGE
jgi:hypothetical protein